MPSLLSRLSSLVPQFKPFATPSANATTRPRPTTGERLPHRHSPGTGRVTFLPYLDDTSTGDSPEIRAAMRKMLREPYVKSGWLTQVLSVLSQPIQVHTPKGKKNRGDQARADFVRHAIEHADSGMLGVGTAVIMNHGSDGYTVAEKVWRVEPRGKYANRFTLAALKPKDVDEHGRLMGDEFNNVTGVYANRTGETWPITDFVYTRYLHTFDEPCGMAAFRSSYGAYWMRDTLRKLRILHHEKEEGLLVGEYEDPVDKSVLEAALERARSSTWLSVPKGVRIDLLKKATSSESEFKSFDESLREEILIGVALAHLHIMQGGVSDARGNTQVHKSVADLGPWLLTYIVQYAINRQMIPDLIDYNFGGADEYPTLTLGGVSNQEILEQLQVLDGAQRAGFKPSRMYYGTELTIQEADPNDPDDQLVPAAQQQAAAGGMGGLGDMLGGMGAPAGSGDLGPLGGGDLGGFGGGGDPFAPSDAGGGAGGGALPEPGDEFTGFGEGFEAFGWDDWTQVEGNRWRSPGGRVLSDPVFQKLSKGKGGAKSSGQDTKRKIPDRTQTPTKAGVPAGGQKTPPVSQKTIPPAGRLKWQTHPDSNSSELRPYTLTQPEYRTLKTRLTRAVNTGDPAKVAAEARAAFRVFEQKGYPDDWSRWQRALDDVLMKERHRAVDRVSARDPVPELSPPPPPASPPKPKPAVKESPSTFAPLADAKLPSMTTQTLYALDGRQERTNPRFSGFHDLAAEDGIWTDLNALLVLPEVEQKKYRERWEKDLKDPKKFITKGVRKPPAKSVLEQAYKLTMNSPQAEAVGLVSYASSNPADKEVRQVVGFRSGEYKAAINPKYYSLIARRYPNAVWKLARKQPAEDYPIAAWVGDKIVGLVMAIGGAAKKFAELPFDNYGETGHIEYFGWEDWKPQGEYMVSPGGRVLRRDTYDRLKAGSGDDAPPDRRTRRDDGDPTRRPSRRTGRTLSQDQTIQARLAKIRGNPAEAAKEVMGDVRAAAAELATARPDPEAVKSAVTAATPGLDPGTQKELGNRLAQAVTGDTPQKIRSGFWGVAKWAASLTGRAAVWAVRGLLAVSKALLRGAVSLLPPGVREFPEKFGRAWPSIAKYVGVIAGSAALYASAVAVPAMLPVAWLAKLGIGVTTAAGASAWYAWGMRGALKKIGKEAGDKWRGGTWTGNAEPPQAGEEVALAGKDGRRAAALMGKAQQAGREVLAKTTEAAVARLLADPEPLDNSVLFTDDELQAIADSLSGTIATADLLGRSRVRRLADLAEKSAEKFSEADADPFDVFADPPDLLPPSDAVNYFRRLVPTVGVRPDRYAPLLDRQAFTLAVAADQSVLNQVKQIILDQIEAGRRPQAVADIRDELDAAGLTPRNPQYADMVYRTNMNDAYMQGFSAEMADPGVQETFPVWQYHGIRDGRQGEDHEPKFDRYYPATVPFGEVRGPRVFNCRCSGSPVNRHQWRALQARGARVEDSWR